MQVRNLAKSLVIGAALLGSSSVLALGLDGVYVLGGVGYTGIEDAKFASSNNLNGGSAFGNPSNLEADGDLSWRAGIGMWVWDNFGVEFNYQGLRNFTNTKHSTVPDNAVTEDLGINGDAVYEKLHVSNVSFFDISGIGRCFFTEDEKFWGFARAGVAYATIKRKVEFVDESNPAVGYAKDNEGGMGATAGLGVQYDIIPAVGVRLEGSTIQALNNNNSYGVTANVVVNLSNL